MRFRRSASTLVQVWERARQQIGMPPGRRAVLTAGCEISIWDPLLLNWLLFMRTSAPHLALRTEIGFPDDLLNRVAEGVLDIAIVYAPHQRPGLRIELLIEEKLVMVTTSKRGQMPRPADYVYVDWGPDFAAQHSLAFPQLSNAGVSAGVGPLGREYLLTAGGAGYFRLEVISAHLNSGRLHRVRAAPEFLYPAYAPPARRPRSSTLQLLGYCELADLVADPLTCPGHAGLQHLARAAPAVRADIDTSPLLRDLPAKFDEGSDRRR